MQLNSFKTAVDNSDIAEIKGLKLSVIIPKPNPEDEKEVIVDITDVTENAMIISKEINGSTAIPHSELYKWLLLMWADFQ